MRRVLALIMLSAALHGCASKSGRQCEDNFETQGSMLTGKTFSTYAYLPATPYAVAFKNASATMAKEGFYIQNADAKTGILSAYQNVMLSERTAPINLLVSKEEGGSKVTFSFYAAAGMYTPESDARSQFCKYMNQIGR